MILPLLLLRSLVSLTTGTLQIDAGSPDALEVTWSGCVAELRGPTCATTAGDELVVWARASGHVLRSCASPSLVVAGRGHRTIATGEEDGGCWTRVEVDDPAGLLELRDAGGRSRWSLPFVPAPTSDPALQAAGERRNAGDPAGARRLLDAAIDRLRIGGEPLDLAHALQETGNLAFQHQDFDGGLALAAEARDRYASLGWISEACDVTFSIANYHWTERHDLDAARATLRSGLPCIATSPRYVLNYRNLYATLMEQAGNLSAAHDALTDLDGIARRIQNHDFEAALLAAQYDLADQLHLHGELDRVRRRLVTLLDQGPGATRCGYVNALSTFTWTTLLRRARGESGADPWPWITHVRASYAEGPCANPDDFRNATINLGLAALQRGDPRQAEALLINLPEDHHDPEAELWRHRILAGAGLAYGNIKLVAAHADALDRLAARYPDAYFAWHAAVTRGALAEGLGQPGYALAAYREAETARDEMTLPLALGAGRERLGADWEESTRRLVDLELALNQPDAALRTVRHARRRALHAIFAVAALDDAARSRLFAEVARERDAIDADARMDDERTGVEQDRELARRARRRVALRGSLDAALGDAVERSAELRPPRAGELLLVFHRTRDRWYGFADDGVHIRTSSFTSLDELPDAQLGPILFGPFDQQIAAASAIRILANDALLQRDLHALPFRGEPLLAHATVAYSLDLGEAPLATRLMPPSPLARGLVVTANPGGKIGNLAAVEHEAEQVVQAWQDLGMVTRRIRGTAATRPGVLAALAGVGIFHFTGHSLPRPEPSGSDHPWDLELLLEQGTSLSVEDVLLGPVATMPRVVVLSACETGKTDSRAVSGGVGIGPTFLLRGSELVLATSRPVSDAVAARVGAAIYEVVADQEALADASTLAAAQRELLGDDTCADHPDICAYRAWIR